MAPRQDSDSCSALILAAAAPPMVAPILEEFGDQPCSSRKSRRTGHGSRYCDYYTEEELETADALILLSLSQGGACVSSSTAAESASNSGDIENNATDHTTTISRDKKNPLLLRIKVSGKEKNCILHKSCDREFSSPQTLGSPKPVIAPTPSRIHSLL